VNELRCWGKWTSLSFCVCIVRSTQKGLTGDSSLGTPKSARKGPHRFGATQACDDDGPCINQATLSSLLDYGAAVVKGAASTCLRFVGHRIVSFSNHYHFFHTNTNGLIHRTRSSTICCSQMHAHNNQHNCVSVSQPIPPQVLLTKKTRRMSFSFIQTWNSQLVLFIRC